MKAQKKLKKSLSPEDCFKRRRMIKEYTHEIGREVHELEKNILTKPFYHAKTSAGNKIFLPVIVKIICTGILPHPSDVLAI